MPIYDSILITGGRGMLAQSVADSCRSRRLKFHLAPRAELDITHLEQTRAAFATHRPTLVINCAAYTKVDQAEKEPDIAAAINGDGPAHLATVCRENGAALVHYSTDYVFNGNNTRPWRTDDTPDPKSVYGKTKLAGEQAISSIAPERYLILRTSWLYGIGGPNFVKTMLNVARAGKPLTVVNDQTGSPTYTPDLAEATFRLLDNGGAGLFHLSNSGTTTWHDFAAEIFKTFNVPANLSPTTTQAWINNRPNIAPRPAYSVMDLSAAEKIIGQPMRHWREGLNAYCDNEKRMSSK